MRSLRRWKDEDREGEGPSVGEGPRASAGGRKRADRGRKWRRQWKMRF